MNDRVEGDRPNVPRVDAVAPNPEEVLAVPADGDLARLLATVTAEPHRLSLEALEERLAPLQGRPMDEVRAELQLIANELELYRLGYDLGFEDGDAAGYDRAITDAIEHPEAFTARLTEIRR
ncbi:hypothetical protein AB0I34_06955 [Kribbella sp. NPDC050281]|uniref:hypothetical protein n=1 Tax=Kribbella sp. NPDC050281 TaxID=3155515 RepID=UPI0034082EB1